MLEQISSSLLLIRYTFSCMYASGLFLCFFPKNTCVYHLFNSIQATIQGFEAKGFSTEEAEALLRRSVKIACEAREIYYDRCTKDSSDFVKSGTISRRPILVAASIGSYGAYLADGSEYRSLNLVIYRVIMLC